MASLGTVIQALHDNIKPLVTDLVLNGDPLVVKIGKGWPAVNTLQDVGRGEFIAISIHNRERVSVPRRIISTSRQFTRRPCGIYAELNSVMLKPGDSVDIEVQFSEDSTAVNLNDGIGLGAFFKGIDEGATYIAGVDDTLESVAANLATNINDRDLLNEWMSASSDGAVVTVENISDGTLRLRLGVGNLAILTRSVGQMYADMQITVWANTVAKRDLVGNLLESVLADWNHKGRIPLGPEERGRFSMGGGYDDDSETQKDVYERHFMSGVEYTLRYSEIAYPILAGISRTEYSRDH